MKTRRIAVAAVVFALASVPAQAGLFGGKGREKKKLPETVSSEQHMGHYGVHPTRVKARNRADNQDAGRDFIHKLQRRPVFLSHPYVTGAR